MSKYFELQPTNGRKSFYGKALVFLNDRGSVLSSYGLPVARINAGKFEKLADFYSLTTLIHVNTYRARAGLNKLTRKEWEEMKTVNE
jgi:hypothetical protein